VTENQTLATLRKEIDEVDRQIVQLFEARMEIAGKIADAKSGIGKAVFDEERERVVLEKNSDRLQHQEWREELQSVFQEMMKQSRAIQKRRMSEE
jgi:chorismate mutase/prephenate dehydratase